MATLWHVPAPIVPTKQLDYLRGMFVEPNVGSEPTKNENSPRLSTGTVRAHRWEGNQLPTLSMCAEVDLKPINKPLVQEVSVRSKRAIHPQIKRAILLLLVIVTAAISYYAISRYVVAAVVIKGRSMAPTLNDGDRYVLNRWVFRFREPRAGDLVVIRDPGHSDFAVKRIIAIPSDTLLFEDGKIYLNGFKLAESYLAPNTRTSAPEETAPRIKLAKDHYYVLGDNRGNSEDSRVYGAVHRDLIVGMISK